MVGRKRTWSTRVVEFISRHTTCHLPLATYHAGNDKKGHHLRVLGELVCKNIWASLFIWLIPVDTSLQPIGKLRN